MTTKDPVADGSFAGATPPAQFVRVDQLLFVFPFHV
jgi:hypothetical protein